jgi:hypothetical protein
MRRKGLLLGTLIMLASLDGQACSGESQAQSTIKSVTQINGKAQIILNDGRKIVVRPESDQLGIEEIKVSSDRKAVGWLVNSKNPTPYQYDPLSWELVIWRPGNVKRKLNAEQVFWSWSFDNGSTQVAFHTGPMHGEQSSHCELHEVASGRLLKKWDGDLESHSSKRPAWTQHLTH